MTRPSYSKVSRRRVRSKAGGRTGPKLMVLAVAVAVAIAALLLALPGKDSTLRTDQVVILDRTGIAQSDIWRAEGEGHAARVIDQALSDGADTLHLVSMGSDAAAAAALASVDLHVEGNTPNKRQAARDDLKAQILSAIAQILDQPVTTTGTDVVASLKTAAALCRQADRCLVTVLGDMEDSRLVGAASDKAALDALGPLMPSLKNISLTAKGIGASGASAAQIRRVEQVWTELLTNAGATDIHLDRS